MLQFSRCINIILRSFTSLSPLSSCVPNARHRALENSIEGGTAELQKAIKQKDTHARTLAQDLPSSAWFSPSPVTVITDAEKERHIGFGHVR